MGVFGEKLRKQREARALSLDAISTTTKISIRMLRAIEDEHFDLLPGGVFNKGFVRAYARQIGLNEEEAVSDYLIALRENHIQSQTNVPNFLASTGKPTSEANGPDPRNPERYQNTRSNDLHRNDLHSNDLHNPEQRNGPIYRPRLANSAPTTNSATADRRVAERRKEVRRKKDDGEVHPHEARHNGDDIDRDRLEEENHGDDRVNDAHEPFDEVAPSPPLSFLNLNSTPPPASIPEGSDSAPVATADSTVADRASRRVPWEKLAAPLLLVILVAAFWGLRRRSEGALVSRPVATNPSVSQPAAAPNLASAGSQSLPPASSVSMSQTRPATPVPTVASKLSATQPASTPTDADVNPPVAKPQARAAKAESQTTFTLLIRAAQTTWVSVSVDGQPMATETLIAPAHTSVRASREITVRTGNAAGISFLLNDKEIPASGSQDEVRIYTFDASGLRASAALPSSNASR
ncbi:MAG: RodZ domain-containing protein [Candidatus Sulfotelmatobacter sp.]